MITLHEANITSFPLDNGIGVLSDAIKAFAEEELNGLFEFEMEYDSEGHLVDELKEERIIKAKAQDKLGYQLFRIYNITKNHENDNYIVKAQHITYDLANNFVEELIANNISKQQVMEFISNNAVDPHPFNLTSPNTSTKSSTRLYRTNPLQMVAGMEGSVLQIWGGQIERDNFNLIMHDRRGHDDGVTVTYEKNITGLTAEFDISSLVTVIFPFVYIEATEDSSERLITVPTKYYFSEHYLDFEKLRIEPIDYSSDDRIDIQDKTDAEIRAQLQNVASEYFNETGNAKAKATMEVQFAHLWETEEYKDVAPLELVGMGDTVTANHSKLKVDATAIVNYIRYDCIAEVNEEVKLGNVKARFSDSLNKIDKIEQKVEQAESNANQAIISVNGKEAINSGPDEPANAKKDDVWFKIVDGEWLATYIYDGIEWQLKVHKESQEAKVEAQQANNRADEAYDNANLATQNAIESITVAQSAFDKSLEAIGGLTTLTEFVDDNTGAIATIKGDVQGLQTSVSGKVDNDTFTTFVQQTNNSLAGKISMTDAEGVFVKGTTFNATIDGLQTTVSNKADKSTVTQLAGVVDTKISTTDANNRFATQSQLTQTSNSLTSTITRVENIEDWEIGGANLLLKSDNRDKWGTYQGSSATKKEINMKDDWGIPNATQVKITGGTNSIKWLYSTSTGGVVSEKMAMDLNYTYSFYIKNIGGKAFRITVNGLSPSRGTSTVQIPLNFSGKVVVTGKRRIDYDWFQPRVQTNATADEVEFIIAGEKLEKGNKATDWSPAPEDMATQSQISQLDTAINLRVTKDGLINQINVDTSGVLIGGKKLILDGDTTVNGTFRVKNANIESIDAGKMTTGTLDAANVTLINLRGLDIYGSRFRSSAGTDYMEIVGGNIELSLNNGRKLDISPTGFYGYNQGGSVRFQADESRVTSAALGTSNLNVYLAADDTGGLGEVRTVKYSTLGGGGSSTDYDYIKTRTLAVVSPIGRHLYVGTDSGELRVMSQGLATQGIYRDIRARKTFANELEVNDGDILYLRSSDRVRIMGNGTSGAYSDLQANYLRARAVVLNTDLSATNFYIGTGNGDLRVTSNGLADGVYRDVLASSFSGTSVDLRPSAGGTNLYVRPAGNGSVMVTARGTTNTYRPIRASIFDESSSREYKTDIDTYKDSALDVVNSLTVVNFRLKDDIANGIDDYKIGFIAEDSGSIASKDLKAIQSYKVGAYNTKAIQELSVITDDLHVKIDLTREELVMKIADLENRITELESAA